MKLKKLLAPIEIHFDDEYTMLFVYCFFGVAKTTANNSVKMLLSVMPSKHGKAGVAAFEMIETFSSLLGLLNDEEEMILDLLKAMCERSHSCSNPRFRPLRRLAGS